MIALLGVFLSISMAWATSFQELPFPQAVYSAPIVVRGRTDASYSGWVGTVETGRRLFTYTPIEVQEVIKGKVSGSSVVLRQLGGKKDGVAMEVPGTAQFTPGEDVVVFLSEANEDDSHDVKGLMMGKYGIEKDAQGRDFLVGAGILSTTPGELREHEGAIHPENFPQGDSSDHSWTLESLRALVQKQAREGRPVGLVASKPSSPAPSAVPRGATSITPSPLASISVTTSESESQPADSTPKVPWLWILGGVVVLAAIIAYLV